MELPREIEDLISFLERQGFTLLRKDGPDPRSFGNMLIDYGNGSVIVRMDLDRSSWVVAIADTARPGYWYSVGLLRDLVSGRGSDDLSLADKVGIVKAIWQDVMIAFSPSLREETHARLSQLRYEFDKRWLPSWPDAALELESFLSKRGMIRQRREAPEGTNGNRLMQYADAVIAVRIFCRGPLLPVDGRMTAADVDQIADINWALMPRGWRVEVADSTRPDTWYDVSLMRSLIERTDDLSDLLEWANRIWAKIRHAFVSVHRFLNDSRSTTFWLNILKNRGDNRHTNEREMHYPLQFQFVKENWSLIRFLFSDRRREATHARLGRLMI